MPIYEWMCLESECEYETEGQYKMGTTRIPCPRCGGKMSRKVSIPGFRADHTVGFKKKDFD